MLLNSIKVQYSSIDLQTKPNTANLVNPATVSKHAVSLCTCKWTSAVLADGGLIS